MARLEPSAYKPILQYQFKVQFSTLDTGDFMTNAKSTQLPSLEQTPITVDYGNTYIKVKGKTRWNDISMVLYQLEEPASNMKLWDWLLLHQDIESGVDKYKTDYSPTSISIFVKKLDWDANVYKFELVNPLIANIDFGQLDWSSDDILTATLVIAYDYAILTKQ